MRWAAGVWLYRSSYMAEDLTERVRGVLKRLSRERRFNQTTVAHRLNLVPSAVSRNLTQAGRPLSLEFVATIADEAGIHLSELVAPPRAALKQLDADEAALLRWLRLWPKDVTRHLGRFVQFFADEAPPVQQQRNLHELIRNLAQNDRDWLYGVAVMLREGTLPPDLQAGLVQELEAEQYRKRAKRRRET